MEDIESEIIQAVKDNTFFNKIYAEYKKDWNKRKELALLLAKLHNNKKIDVISLFTKLTDYTDSEYFVFHDILSETLPEINSSLLDVLNCVKHFKNETRPGLMESLYQFCVKTPNRPQELLDIALSNIDENIDFLSTALIAGAFIDTEAYIKKTLELVESKNNLINHRAIFSLGIIDFKQNVKLSESSVAKIKAFLKDSDSENLLIAAFESIFAISSNINGMEDEFIDYINCHQSFNKLFAKSASIILFRDHKKVTSKVEKVLLDICIYVDSEEKDTLHFIDHVLARFLKESQFEKSVAFLEQFFEINQYKVSIKTFGNFIFELRNYKDTYLSSLITKWLLSKNINLCSDCVDIIFDTENGLEIQSDKLYIDHSNIENVYLFLSKKACGWFFFQPKTAMSFIFSFLDDASNEELNEIQKIIFNPLLISYPRIVKEFLINSKNSSTPKVIKVIDDLIQSLDKYHHGLSTASNIQELRPSEKNYYIYREYHENQMSSAMKKARKGSLSSLFPTVELLYGNKSINYIKKGKKKIRQETPLHSYSYSIDYAMLLNINPHGLHNVLSYFKSEGCNI